MVTLKLRSQIAYVAWGLSAVFCLLIPPSGLRAEERPEKPQHQSLFFDPKENGIEFLNQSIDYDVGEDDQIRIGPLQIFGREIGLHLSYEDVEFGELGFGLEYKRKKGRLYILSFRWPLSYVTQGRMEFLDDKSKVVWSFDITDAQMKNWANLVRPTPTVAPVAVEGAEKEEKQASTGYVFNHKTLPQVHSASQFGLFGKELLTVPLWKIKRPFRFCITQVLEEGRLAVCSARYKFERGDVGRVKLMTVSRDVQPRVLVNDQAVSLKGSAIFLDKVTPIKFVSLLSSGAYIEFVSAPKPIDIVDMAQTDDGEFVEIIGFGNPPMEAHEPLDRSKEDFWSFLNFNPSIGDFRQFWRAKITNQDPQLNFKGNGGAPFRQSFVFEHLPKQKDRAKIQSSSIPSTYRRQPKVRGVTGESSEVSSEQLSAKKTSSTDFEWTFLASDGARMNRRYLLINDGVHTWKASHDIYRDYPREVGLRLTGVLSSDLEIIFLGEVATQWWFESILGWENPLLSHQRWGLAAKYFQAFASMGKKQKDASLIKLQTTTVDLKYRLSRGVWNRDPTIGLSLNAQSIVLEQYKADLVGGGAFWARSMPRFFNYLVDWIPIFDYPKWVDMEFIVYPVAVSPKTQAGLNFNMNFHGKIFWGRQFYGEAGFGLKAFAFADLVARKQVAAGMAYGTVGLGYNF